MIAIVCAVVVGMFAQLGPSPPAGGPGQGARWRPATTVEVKLADPTVKSATGKVDRMIVKRYLRRELAKYRFCYEKALAADPALKGALTVRFRILPGGTLTSVRVEGIHDEVENCVARFVRGLQLPKVPEEAEVRARLVFKQTPAPLPSRRGGSCLGLGCGTLD